MAFLIPALGTFDCTILDLPLLLIGGPNSAMRMAGFRISPPISLVAEAIILPPLKIGLGYLVWSTGFRDCHCFALSAGG